MTRVWLLYGRSKQVRIFLGLLFVSGFVTALFVSSYSPGVSLVHLPFITAVPTWLIRWQSAVHLVALCATLIYQFRISCLFTCLFSSRLLAVPGEHVW